MRELQANLKARRPTRRRRATGSRASCSTTPSSTSPLTRKDLDEVTRDHPMVVSHRGGHTSWYNTKAFELAGITKDTPDPDHGRFFRDEPAS